MRGRRVGDRHAMDRQRGVEAADAASGHRRLGVALAREDDSDRHVVREFRTWEPTEAADRGGEQQTTQGGYQPRQHDLRLRVTEARIELDHPDARAGHDEPAIEQADERCLLGCELADGGQRDGVDDLVDEPGRQPGERGIRPHPTGVRTFVTVAETLVVLGGRERQHVVPVTQQEEGDLLAVEKLLDENASLAEPVGRVSESRVPIRGDQHALAGGQAIGLDHVGCTIFVDRGDGFVERSCPNGAARRHPCLVHDALGEGLASLERRRGLSGAEDGDTALAQLVRDARDEWCFRPDDDELDVVVESELGDDHGIRRVQGDDGHIRCDAGVARGCGDLMTGVLPEKSGDDGMLPRAGA